MQIISSQPSPWLGPSEPLNLRLRVGFETPDLFTLLILVAALTFLYTLLSLACGRTQMANTARPIRRIMAEGVSVSLTLHLLS